MTFFYFVCDAPSHARILAECGCRNVLTSYAFINHFKGDLTILFDNFDKVFLDSGAFSAFKVGTVIDLAEYTNFVMANWDRGLTVAAQLDVIGDMKGSANNYKEQVEMGATMIMPVLQGDWFESLYYIKKAGLHTDYIGIGNTKWYRDHGYKDTDQFVKTLPKKYRYHGLAKGKYQHFKDEVFHSIDSSTWTFATRAGWSNAWWKGWNLDVEYGRRGRGNVGKIHQVYEMHRQDMEVCGIDRNLLVNGDNAMMQRVIIASYYRPLFRELGIFDKNFRF